MRQAAGAGVHAAQVDSAADAATAAAAAAAADEAIASGPAKTVFVTVVLPTGDARCFRARRRRGRAAGRRGAKALASARDGHR